MPRQPPTLFVVAFPARLRVVSLTAANYEVTTFKVCFHQGKE
jgi:hypothetical protein